MRRPCSLAEVARGSSDWRQFSAQLADFLDQFQLRGCGEMLRDEPERLAGRFAQGNVCDAYLAATAVTLARGTGLAVPAWALANDRKLREPWFALPGFALRSTLLWESPPAFRERNLFVSENALSRA